MIINNNHHARDTRYANTRENREIKIHVHRKRQT